jgi:hypothetical protein
MPGSGGKSGAVVAMAWMVTRLADLPAEWSEQHQILGLSQQ